MAKERDNIFPESSDQDEITISASEITELYEKLIQYVEEDKDEEALQVVNKLKAQPLSVVLFIKQPSIDNMYQAVSKSIRENKFKVVKQIIENSQMLELKHIYPVVIKAAIESANMEALKYITKNTQTKFTWQHIDQAIENGDFELVQYVVENGKEIETENLNTVKNIIDNIRAEYNNDEDEDEDIENKLQENVDYKKNIEIFKYLLLCVDDTQYGFFIEEARNDDADKYIYNHDENYIDKLNDFVASIDGMFKPFLRSTPNDKITCEDIRCIKASLHYFINRNGLSPILQENIKRVISNSDVLKEILEEVNKVPLTDKKEIGKMIEPVLASILYHYTPQEFSNVILYSQGAGDTIKTTSDNVDYSAIYDKYPQYKTEKCFDYLTDPENFKSVTALLISDLQNAELICSILTNNIPKGKQSPIIYSIADADKLKDFVKKFNKIKPEIKSLLVEQQDKIKVFQDQLQEKQAEINRLLVENQKLLQEQEVPENKPRSFVDRIGGKRRHSDSSLINESKKTCVRKF